MPPRQVFIYINHTPELSQLEAKWLQYSASHDRYSNPLIFVAAFPWTHAGYLHLFPAWGSPALSAALQTCLYRGERSPPSNYWQWPSCSPGCWGTSLLQGYIAGFSLTFFPSGLHLFCNAAFQPFASKCITVHTSTPLSTVFHQLGNENVH